MSRRPAAAVAGGTGLGAWLAFGVLAWLVRWRDGAPLWPDGRLLSWSVGHRPDAAVTVARGVTDTGTGVLPYAAAALAGVLAGRTARQRLWAVALCLACLVAGQALRYGLVELVRRPRPPLADRAAPASGWAFPSGHTATAAVAAGLLVVAVSLRAPRGATPLRIAIGCWGALVGLTRVYLGVHWFTDVVGGWLFAAGWLGVVLAVVLRWPPGVARHERGARGGPHRDAPPGGVDG